MSHAQTLAYLVAALAASPSAIFAVKYLLQFTKGLLPLPTTDPAKANATRLYAVALGVVSLPALIAASAYAGIGVGYDLHELPVDAVVGAGAGLAAVGDYHLLSLLQSQFTRTPAAPPAEPPAA